MKYETAKERGSSVAKLEAILQKKIIGDVVSVIKFTLKMWRLEYV